MVDATMPVVEDCGYSIPYEDQLAPPVLIYLRFEDVRQIADESVVLVEVTWIIATLSVVCAGETSQSASHSSGRSPADCSTSSSSSFILPGKLSAAGAATKGVRWVYIKLVRLLASEQASDTTTV